MKNVYPIVAFILVGSSVILVYVPQFGLNFENLRHDYPYETLSAILVFFAWTAIVILWSRDHYLREVNDDMSQMKGEMQAQKKEKDRMEKDRDSYKKSLEEAREVALGTRLRQGITRSGKDNYND